MRKFGWLMAAAALSAPMVGVAAAGFKLDTRSSSLVFELGADGAWRWPYYGAKVAAAADVLDLEGGPYFDDGLTRYPTYDTYGARYDGDEVEKFGGLAVRHADGYMMTELKALGRAPVELGDEEGVRHWAFPMKDCAHGFFATQHFRADFASDVVETWMEFRNAETAAVELVRMDAFAWSMHRLAKRYRLHSLSSWWGREAQLREAELVPSQALVLDNRNGIHSAWNANPAFMLDIGGDSTEATGEVLGGVLAWSGVWRIGFRLDWKETLSIVAGPDNGNGAYVLDAGRSLKTPVFAFTWSRQGRGQVSRNFHRWARHRWLPHRTAPREVLLNSWEGSYLTFKEQTLTDMMDGVAEMGGEMFVLDDGWFGEGEFARDHDVPQDISGLAANNQGGKCDAGLGDWVVNRRKLPRGLEYLTAAAAKRGLKFGLWVEPEMANFKSRLLTEHPEFATQIPNRENVYGRGGTQNVLDFANPKVVDAIFRQLDAIYSIPGLAYVKWDANANFFNPGSLYLGAGRQGNLWFDYATGVQDLLERLRQAHPEIVTQACSSGGGRMEYGFLRYCDEAWVSDITDARERVFMQWGASQFYPASVLAAHVTARENHATRRVISLKFRFDVAMSGRLGFELRPVDLSREEVEFARRCVADYKRLRPVIQGGDLYRLKSPYDSNYSSLMFVSEDQTQAVVFVYGLNRSPLRDFVANVRPAGLDPAKRYRIREINRWGQDAPHVVCDGKVVGGDALMNAGFEPLLANRDYDSCVLELTAQ